MDSRTKTSLLEKEVQTKNALINELVDQINELKYLVNALMSEQQRPESPFTYTETDAVTNPIEKAYVVAQSEPVLPERTDQDSEPAQDTKLADKTDVITSLTEKANVAPPSEPVDETDPVTYPIEKADIAAPSEQVLGEHTGPGSEPWQDTKPVKQ